MIFLHRRWRFKSHVSLCETEKKNERGKGRLRSGGVREEKCGMKNMRDERRENQRDI